MATKQPTHTEAVASFIKDELADAEWVLNVRALDGDEYDIAVDTNVRFVSTEGRVHTLEQLGVSHAATAYNAGPGFTLYCNLD